MAKYLLDLLRTPQFGDEDIDRTAQLLNMILWAFLILAAGFVVALAIFAPEQQMRIIPALGMVVIILGCLLLLRRGYVHLSGGLLLTALWLVMTFAFVISGGVQAPGYAGYLVVILLGGLLLGGRAALTLAVVCVMAGLTMLYMDTAGRLPAPLIVDTPLSAWMLQTVYFLGGAALIYLAIGGINRTLANERQYIRLLASRNQELQEIRQSLEKQSHSLSQLNQQLQYEIVERKRVEEALRASESHFRAVFNAAQDAMVIVDDAGRYTMANAAAERLFKTPLETLLERSIKDFVASDYDYGAVWQRFLENGWGQGEMQLICPDGAVRDVEYAATANFMPDRHMAVLRDVTERKQTEEFLRHKQKLESLGLLAGGVAHDFNNLLVALLGQTSLALARLSLENPAYEHINKANKVARRAADLTQQLLAYSGRGQFTVDAVHLNSLIEENLQLLKTMIPKQIHLQLELAEELPLIEVDQGQIQQVIMNLILNSAEAIGKSSGMITLVTGFQTITGQDTVYWEQTVEPLEPGPYVTLEVHDTGNGMDQQTVQRIFEPFYTTKPQGHGLGLAAVLGIVRGHRGGLRVYSEAGKGTTFKLLFPANLEAERPARPAREATSFSGIEGIVLVIDDEEPVLEAVTDIFELEGVGVLTANSGQAGVEIFRQKAAHIDLVLLDLSMPGMSGIETFRELQRIDPTVPVILSSGYNQLEATRQFAGKGLADFIQKPYDVSQLLTKVHYYLAQKK